MLKSQKLKFPQTTILMEGEEGYLRGIKGQILGKGLAYFGLYAE